MKTEFPCGYCGKQHEEKDTVPLKVDGGLNVYGIACVVDLVREVDALSQDEAAAELVGDRQLDALRELFLVQRAQGRKSTGRIRRRVEDVNLILVKGGRG